MLVLCLLVLLALRSSVDFGEVNLIYNEYALLVKSAIVQRGGFDFVGNTWMDAWMDGWTDGLTYGLQWIDDR